MIAKFLQFAGISNQNDRLARLKRDFIRHEAKIGGQLFGPVPPGGRRDFFRLDAHTWIWYEEWKDANGNKQSRTTRYDVRPDIIVKAQDGQPYRKVSDEEALRLRDAIHVYIRRCSEEVYGFAKSR